MNSTSESLFDRLRDARPDDSDWGRLHDLYGPLIRRWLAKLAVPESDLDDLSQEVLATMAREVPGFRPQRPGSFRAWLLNVCRNRVGTYWRGRKREPHIEFDRSRRLLGELVDPRSDASREFNRIYDKELIRKLLAVIRPDFQDVTWIAFTRLAIEGIPIGQVAEELGITENAALQAQKRVKNRLKAEGGHFLH